MTLHRLYDIYNTYDGMENLCTVNDNAGGSAVQADERIISLLRLSKEMHSATGGRVNVMMGSVLSLWHEARADSLENPERAYIPDAQALSEAAKHTDINLLEIDEAHSTVRIADKEARLDVGAIAKGYASQRVCDMLPTGYFLSAGGNIAVTGEKPDGGAWVVGIQKPFTNDVLAKLSVKHGSVVTSGNYQRFYTVNGKMYHHIIDPLTCMPSAYWAGVTVVCEDSGIADALSTALFLTDREGGTSLLKKYGAEALWVDADGNIQYTDGLASMILP